MKLVDGSTQKATIWLHLIASPRARSEICGKEATFSRTTILMGTSVALKSWWINVMLLIAQPIGIISGRLSWVRLMTRASDANGSGHVTLVVNSITATI